MIHRCATRRGVAVEPGFIGLQRPTPFLRNPCLLASGHRLKPSRNRMEHRLTLHCRRLTRDRGGELFTQVTSLSQWGHSFAITTQGLQQVSNLEQNNESHVELVSEVPRGGMSPPLVWRSLTALNRVNESFRPD